MSGVTRRDALAGGGITVLFALAAPVAWAQGGSGGGEGPGGADTVAPGLPGDLSSHPMLDAWIRIDATGHATVCTGKAELGQGIRTAFIQLAADELDMAPARLTLVTADTARTPDEGVTAGSHSMEDSGTAIAVAAANVRALLLAEAARRWTMPAAGLTTADGQVRGGPGGGMLGYGELASTASLRVPARADVPRRAVGTRRWIGKPVPRVDLPGKLTGAPAYVHDLTFPDMLHARVVRGPFEGTRIAIGADALRGLPGVDAVVERGRFLAILGRREWPLVQALRLAGEGRWEATGALPPGDITAKLKSLPARTDTILDRRAAPGFDRQAASGLDRQAAPGLAPVRRIAARYTRPWLLHGAIGPSCAVALARDGQLTVWTHSQGVEPLRSALAELTGLAAERIRCIHIPGAGCYGHNGADDVAADAALAALGLPGRPVKLLWSREQEHGWEPAGPAQIAELAGGIDAAGRIAAWDHQVWSNTHTTRPAGAGDLIAGGELEPPFAPSPPRAIPQPEGGGDRNSVPLYALPNARVVHHFLPDMPVRVSALRSLGAHMNVFAIESFLDELAVAGGRDPVALRLAHMQDGRARAVIERAAQRFGWTRYRQQPFRGRGFGFARYKNLGAFCAVAMDVEVWPETGRLVVHRAVAAVDSGDAVNPDGIRNQIEGGIVQSLSWSSVEALRLGGQGRMAYDWSTYPILRFDGVPRAIAVEVVNRPGQPFLGTGEAAQGPTAAALANAIAHATGQRRRAMPVGGQAVV